MSHADAHLTEHILEVFLGIHPWGYGITEEDEILNHPIGIHTDHVTHPTERRVLLVIVTDIAQRTAPVQGRGTFASG